MGVPRQCSTREQFPPLWQKGHIWDLLLNCGQQHLRRFSTSLGFEESQKHSRGSGWFCGVQRSHVFSAQRAACSPRKLLWPRLKALSRRTSSEPETSPSPQAVHPSRQSWEGLWLRHELLVKKQLEMFSSAGVLALESHWSWERHAQGFRDMLHPTEPKVMRFMAKQMDFTGRRGWPPEEGLQSNWSQYQICAGLLSNVGFSLNMLLNGRSLDIPSLSLIHIYESFPWSPPSPVASLQQPFCTTLSYSVEARSKVSASPSPFPH